MCSNYNILKRTLSFPGTLRGSKGRFQAIYHISGHFWTILEKSKKTTFLIFLQNSLVLSYIYCGRDRPKVAGVINGHQKHVLLRLGRVDSMVCRTAMTVCGRGGGEKRPNPKKETQTQKRDPNPKKETQT